jgi:hypothetical protein
MGCQKPWDIFIRSFFVDSAIVTFFFPLKKTGEFTLAFLPQWGRPGDHSFCCPASSDGVKVWMKAHRKRDESSRPGWWVSCYPWLTWVGTFLWGDRLILSPEESPLPEWILSPWVGTAQQGGIWVLFVWLWVSGPLDPLAATQGPIMVPSLVAELSQMSLQIPSPFVSWAGNSFCLRAYGSGLSQAMTRVAGC